METKTLFNPMVSHYKNVRDTQPTPGNLGRAIVDCTTGKWKTQVELVRQEKDEIKRRLLKAQILPCFTPSGLFSGGSDDTLQEHSGFISIDIDAKENPNVANFKNFKTLIAEVPYVAACLQSCGGEGFFCLIQIADPTRHRGHFRALAQDFYDAGLVIDLNCINVGRKRFYTYDPGPYINTAARVYDRISEGEGHTTKEVFGKTLTDAETREKFGAVVKEIAERHIDITGGYHQWFRVLQAIASTFGEDGRDAAHTVSSQADCYNHSETDHQYTNCVKNIVKSPINIGTFFYTARQELNKHAFDGITDEDAK